LNAQSPRETALRTLYRFETEGGFVRDYLEDAFASGAVDTRNRAFITELVYGTTRWKGRLDWIINSLARRGADSLTPWIKNILRLGVYQLLMMDHVPDAAATDESVKLAKRYGHSGVARFTNAMLREVIRRRPYFLAPVDTGDEAVSLSLTYSYPEWMVKRWLTRHGRQKTEEMLKAGNQAPGITARVNRMKITVEELTGLWRADGLEPAPGRYLEDFLTIRGAGVITRLPGYTEGFFQIQDESAGLAVRLLDPRPGETIIDLCCAPGGKATYIAELMSDRGVVVGADRMTSRMRAVRENSQRLGLKSICPVVMDGCSPGVNVQTDRALIDAPCTGLGTVGRRADLRWRRQPEDIPAAQRLQKTLLDQGARLVKPGGVLVYSTCTTEPEENEQVIDAFLRRHPQFRIAPPENRTVPWRETLDEDGMIRTFPSIDGMDGSFAARLRRVN
jgi:16S rRNA (cytosine967-C5)-methyltransferase